MQKYLSNYAFSKLVGVSRQAIGDAIKDARVYKSSRGIDPKHPTNKYYAQNQDGRRKQLIQKKTHKPIMIKKKVVKGSAPKKKKRGRPAKKKTSTVKNKSPNQKINRQKETLQESIDQAQERIEKPSPSNPNHNAENYDVALGTLNAKQLKELEQVKKLQVDTEIKRKQLVDRSIVERVFSELYLVDTNELKTLGGKLAPRIAAKYKIDDSEKIIEVERLIEEEVYRTLEHIKRIFNDVLEDLEVELIG